MIVPPHPRRRRWAADVPGAELSPQLQPVVDLAVSADGTAYAAQGAEDSDLAVSTDGTRVFVAGRGRLDDGRIGAVVWVVG
jgi:hypothetical protein